MMDHIINFDWNHWEPEEHFIRPEDLDNSVTEKILRNKFRDPLISSDEEEEPNRPKVNWDALIARSRPKNTEDQPYVPGLLPTPRYLKLSAMTKKQHFQCLKVLCEKDRHLPRSFMYPPNKQDLKVMEELQEVYEKEQKEFKEWAKVLWTNDHCRRALRPRPRVETVYEAHFKIRAQEMESYPKSLRLAAHIPLESLNDNEFDFVHQKDLITVNIDELPEVECPLAITTKLSVMKPAAIPEPCPLHPCKFILPNETVMTEKPLTEVHRSLAQWAVDNSCQCVAGESALCCLLEQDRNWILPFSVVDMYGADGEPCNIIVFGSEFAVLKEPPPVRTYQALRNMLDVALVEDTEMVKLKYNPQKLLRIGGKGGKDANKSNSFEVSLEEADDSSDNEEVLMVIDIADDPIPSTPKRSKVKMDTSPIIPRFNVLSPRRTYSRKKPNEPDNLEPQPSPNTRRTGAICTCRGTLYENPAPRSYRKWRLRNKARHDNIDIIVHCAHKHKAKDRYNEVLLEPIPEYQLDLGASEQPQSKAISSALSLMLHKNATLANVRIDCTSGDIVKFECYTAQQHTEQYGKQRPHIANVLHSTLTQLKGLLPGYYVLKHESSHGANAMLFASRGRSGTALSLSFDAAALHPDDTPCVRTPPTLSAAILPVHRHRSMLPLSFTYWPSDVARVPQKPVTRTKPPPQALPWPKRKGKKRKSNY